MTARSFWADITGNVSGRTFLPFVGISAGIFLSGSIIGFVIRIGRSVPHEISTASAVVPSTGDVVFANMSVSAVLIYGGFLLGLPTLIQLIVNGVAFGSVVASILDAHGPRLVVLTLLPHGLVEVPAAWIAGAIGLSLARRVLGGVFGGGFEPANGCSVSDYVSLALISLGLLVLGAAIETELTPWLVRTFG